MIYVGIDIGKKGGFAILIDDFVIVYPYNDKEFVAFMRSLWARDTKVMACVEHVGAMPGQGVTSMFSFGKSADILDVVKQTTAIASNRPTTAEAWAEVVKKANIYATITWSHPHVKQAVQVIGLRNICISDCIGVERAHFFKVYDALQERQTLSDDLTVAGLIDEKARQAIAKLSSSMGTSDATKGAIKYE